MASPVQEVEAEAYVGDAEAEAETNYVDRPLTVTLPLTTTVSLIILT